MGKENFIPEKYQKRRGRFEKFASNIPVFRSEIENIENLEGVREILRDTGLCIVANHFSRKETAHMFQIPFRDPELRKREIIAPVAKHQKMFFMDPLSQYLGVNLKYLVTDETVSRAERKGREIYDKTEGRREFLDDALGVIDRGGIAIIYPQASRKEKLDPENSPKTMGNFLALAARKNVKMGFLFVGVDLEEEVEDYSRVNGYNLFKKYKLKIGDSMRVKDVLAEADNDFRKVDTVIYNKLKPLVSPKYAGIMSLDK